MAHLEGIAADDLRQYLAEVEGKQATQRIMVGLNYKNGQTQAELAEMYGVTEKTIYNWLCRLDRLANEPVEEVVYDDDRSGRPPKLTEKEHERLEEVLLQPPTESTTTRRRGRRRSPSAILPKPLMLTTVSVKFETS